MNTKFKSLIYVSIALSFILFISCNMSKKTTSNISEIIFHFEDSSVPPEDHRSYTITANSDTIQIIVDSYGDIISDSSFVFSSKNMDILIEAIKDTQLKNKRMTEDKKGCTGGTSKSITVYAEDEKIINGTTYSCGGQKYGDLSGDINSFSQIIKSFIPNFGMLTE